jgi:UTP-glucose-1-phosphate uridylyltransferase
MPKEFLPIVDKPLVQYAAEEAIAATWADTTLIEKLTGYQSTTEIKNGVIKSIQWYRDYYGV